MTNVEDHKSGKGAGDENFPVASHLIAKRHRGPILAYYRFARSADDAADHPTLPEAEKLRLLDALENTLLGHSDEAADALPLRAALAERRMSPRHALDLLVAFRQDVTKRRYATWDELIDYCRYSAAPVGRFVLDVHGESAATYAPNDALCTALQIINHVQDCAKDYRTIDRVYMPADMLASHGATTDMLNRDRATPELSRAVKAVVARTLALMPDARQLPAVCADIRLGLETAIIARLATTLLARLETHDPLSERVHLSKAEAAGVALGATLSYLLRTSWRSRPLPAISTNGPR